MWCSFIGSGSRSRPTASSSVCRSIGTSICGVQTSLETRLLKITASSGSSEKTGYYIAPLEEPRNITEIFPVGVAVFWPLESFGATHYALTDS